MDFVNLILTSIKSIIYIYFFNYSLLGNSMRSYVLLRLVEGKELWTSIHVVFTLYLKNIILIINIYHGKFDRIGFCYFEIWRCGYIEMMKGIGADVFFLFQGIVGVSLEYRRKYVSYFALFCFVLPCLPCFVLALLLLLLLVLRWFCWSCCCCCWWLPSHHRAACVTRGTHSRRYPDRELAGRSGWQQPCVLETNFQRSPSRA